MQIKMNDAPMNSEHECVYHTYSVALNANNSCRKNIFFSPVHVLSNRAVSAGTHTTTNSAHHTGSHTQKPKSQGSKDSRKQKKKKQDQCNVHFERINESPI